MICAFKNLIARNMTKMCSPLGLYIISGFDFKTAIIRRIFAIILLVPNFEGYDFRIFTDFQEMRAALKRRENEFGR